MFSVFIFLCEIGSLFYFFNSSIEFSRMVNMKMGCYSKHVILMISAQPKGKNERNILVL